MSDFFSNLVSRARAAQPALRPNLASRFEPPREAPHAAALGAMDAETEPAVRSPAPRKVESRKPELPTPAQPDRFPAEPEASEPTVSSMESKHVFSVPSPKPATRDEVQPPNAPPVGESSAAVPESALLRDRVTAPRQRDATPTAAPEPQAALLPDHATPDESEDEPATLGEPPIPSFDTTEAKAAPTLGPFATDTPRAFPASRSPVRPRRVSRSQEQAQTARAAGVSESTSAPDSTPPMVHVTIGRLEIRAITPQTPPPGEPRAAGGPRLSLDEYLRRNHGGAR